MPSSPDSTCARSQKPTEPDQDQYRQPSRCGAGQLARRERRWTTRSPRGTGRSAMRAELNGSSAGDSRCWRACRDQRHQRRVRQIHLARESRHNEITALVHLPRHAEVRRVVEFPRIVAGEPERDPSERQQQQSRLLPGAMRSGSSCGVESAARVGRMRVVGMPGRMASGGRRRNEKGSRSSPLSQHPSGNRDESG